MSRRDQKETLVWISWQIWTGTQNQSMLSDSLLMVRAIQIIQGNKQFCFVFCIFFTVNDRSNLTTCLKPDSQI